MVPPGPAGAHPFLTHCKGHTWLEVSGGPGSGLSLGASPGLAWVHLGEGKGVGEVTGCPSCSAHEHGLGASGVCWVLGWLQNRPRGRERRGTGRVDMLGPYPQDTNLLCVCVCVCARARRLCLSGCLGDCLCALFPSVAVNLRGLVVVSGSVEAHAYGTEFL